jgi:N-acetylglucosamine-6-phosphate deacetylase
MPADGSLTLGNNDGEVLGLRGRLATGLPGEEVIDDGTVVIAGGSITWCGPTAELPAGVDVEITQVPLILPGLVDVHCHGGFGHTFSADQEAARKAARQHAAHGTTSLLASLVSAPSEVLLEQILVLRELVEDGILAGLHLEGPFITKSMCGAQDPSAIIDGDPALLKQWLDAGRGTVRSLTLAPETAHFDELVALCREYGVVPSLGHTDATAARTREALAEATPGGGQPWSATHLFNRMPPLGHRLPGPVAVLLQAAQQNPEQMVLELIADGVHLDPEIVRMVFALVGPRSIALITDAMAAAGMADGPYTLGSLDVTVSGGIARLGPSGGAGVAGANAGQGVAGAIAGGTSRLLGNVRRCVEWEIPLTDAVAAASFTPARLMGLHHLGALLEGKRADLLVINDELEVLRVYRAGTQVTQEGSDRADSAV